MVIFHFILSKIIIPFSQVQKWSKHKSFTLSSPGVWHKIELFTRLAVAFAPKVVICFLHFLYVVLSRIKPNQWSEQNHLLFFYLFSLRWWWRWLLLLLLLLLLLHYSPAQLVANIATAFLWNLLVLSLWCELMVSLPPLRGDVCHSIHRPSDHQSTIVNDLSSWDSWCLENSIGLADDWTNQEADKTSLTTDESLPVVAKIIHFKYTNDDCNVWT